MDHLSIVLIIQLALNLVVIYSLSARQRNRWKTVALIAFPAGLILWPFVPLISAILEAIQQGRALSVGFAFGDPINYIASVLSVIVVQLYFNRTGLNRREL